MLASRLREDGVDVILDKWDLKPGHDSIAFMESMVTDKSVTKVIMICDRVYVEKADARQGGVGTESQIISPEIYASSSQDKFAAVMTEADEQGQAYIPTYYRGRIYFNFLSGETFEDSYEQLLRWLVNRPQHVKPKLGAVPESILSVKPAATATQSRAKRAEDALRQGASSSAAMVREYSEALLPELKALAPQIGNREEADEKILAAVDAMRPYVRQFSEIVLTAARYAEDMRIWDAVLMLVERIGRLMSRDEDVTNWHSHQFDAFKIIANNLFLSLIALCVDEDRFDLACAALARPWLLREHDGANRRSTSDFSAFNQHVASLDHRNQRLRLNRISLEADILRNAHPQGSLPSFESILQADFIIFLRSLDEANEGRWYPFPQVYAADRFSPYPVFARAESAGYFKTLAPVLGVADLESFKQRVEAFNASSRASQMFAHHGFPVSYLANLAFLGTRP